MVGTTAHYKLNVIWYNSIRWNSHLVMEGDATKNSNLLTAMPASSLKEDIFRMGCPGGICVFILDYFTPLCVP